MDDFRTMRITGLCSKSWVRLLWKSFVEEAKATQGCSGI